MPRDRHGTFEPRLIPKHARRFAGFDDKILALYARGMTVREIQAFLAEMYAVEGHGLATATARADVSGGVLRRTSMASGPSSVRTVLGLVPLR
jgi:hypothetical protein